MADCDPGESVHFRVLGPLEVTRGERSIPITAARHQVVLAMLLLEVGRVVSVERLVDALWAEDPPSTARSQVQICVSMLRKLLAGGGADLLSRPPGYMLQVPDGSLDVWRFRQLTAVAEDKAGTRPEEAVARYREGLALWRGEACAGVASRIVDQAAIRLNEERRAALEACLDLELRLGRHHRVAGELAELVAAAPLRERPRALLMLALYRSGRQAEALEVFRLGREILVEELGADPGKELRALEQAILTGDGVLDPPAAPAPGRTEEPALAVPRPRPLPATVADFVGREDLLRAACGVLEPPSSDAGDGRHVAVVMLTGRGGIGKTTLALQTAHAVRDAFADGQLFARLRESGGPATSPAGVLEQFLRSLGVAAPAIPDSLLERTAMFRSCLAGRRVLIVLDDAVSLSQVEPLLPGEAGCGVIITSRARLPGPPGVAQLEVGVLERQAAVELLDQVIGFERTGAEPEATTELIRLCEGLPLALRISASKLAARGHWQVGRMVERLTDERRRLDELDLEGASIRATLEFSYGSLPEEAQQLLDRLSLLDQADFPEWVSAPLLDMPAAPAEDVLEDLVAGGLVEARASHEQAVRYRMHDMVRLFAREKLAETHRPADRMAAIRRYVGCWLALVSDAHRRYHGGDFYVVHGRGETWPLPQSLTDKLLLAPMRWFYQERNGLVEAILLASRARLDELCWDLAVQSVTFFELGLYPDDWYQTHEAALAVTRQAGNDRGTAALLHSLGLRSMSRDIEESRDYLRQSLELWERLDDPHGSALALAGLANADRLAGDFDAAQNGYNLALNGFEEVGDLAGQASALRGLGQIAMEREHAEAARGLLERSIAVSRQAGAERDVTQSMYYSAELLWRCGDFAQAEERLHQVRRKTHETGDVVGEGYSLLGLAITRTHTGAVSQADSDLRQAQTLAERSGDVLLRGRIMLARAELDAVGGRTERARAVLAEAIGTFSRLGSPPLWRAKCQELESRIGLVYAPVPGRGT
jgi:DNA-binding SARP family transcriptional activator